MARATRPSRPSDFFEFVEGPKAPKLPELRYSVLALGDLTDEHYCEAGRASTGASKRSERPD